jgi:aquaporin Z
VDPRKLLAEALGTAVLVFVGGVSILAGINFLAGSTNETAFLVVIAFGFGLGLLAALYAFAEISGGHFNPAVSLAFMLSGRMAPNDMIAYWVAQFVGGIGGAVAIAIAFGSDGVDDTATIPSNVWDAFWLELVLTAIFVAVILQSTRSQRVFGNALLAIPLTLVAIHLAAVPFSGASVNPARTLGTALIGTEFSDLWIYFIAPPIGAVIGALVHMYLYGPVEEAVEVEVVEVQTS